MSGPAADGAVPRPGDIGHANAAGLGHTQAGPELRALSPARVDVGASGKPSVCPARTPNQGVGGESRSCGRGLSDRAAVAFARGHEELALVAHTSGPTDLVAHALCRDTAALYHYLTHGLGAVKAIRTLESAPVLRTLKAVGTIASTPVSSRPGQMADFNDAPQPAALAMVAGRASATW
jgi:hypothetical protein